jgi:hypothetical protein
MVLILTLVWDGAGELDGIAAGVAIGARVNTTDGAVDLTGMDIIGAGEMAIGMDTIMVITMAIGRVIGMAIAMDIGIIGGEVQLILVRVLIEMFTTGAMIVVVEDWHRTKKLLMD